MCGYIGDKTNVFCKYLLLERVILKVHGYVAMLSVICTN